MNKKYYIIGGILILLLILAGVVLFSSSSNKAKPNSNTKITLTWWKPFEDSENVQDLISDYQALHKNVTINFVKKDSNTYEKELVDAIASGSGPDIFSIHNDWLPKHLNKIAPVPNSIMSIRDYKDNFVDVAFGDFVKNNQIYSIPLSTDVLALYYNEDLLTSAGISQPPKTWSDVVSDAQKITKVSKSGDFIRSGIAMGTSSNVNRAVDILTLLMLQNGTKFYSDDLGTSRLNQTQSVSGSTQTFNPGSTALAFYTQFAQPSKTSYSWNVKSDQSVDDFTQGTLGMMLSYSYMEPLIKARAPNLNWGIAAIPQVTEDSTKINFANYWAESVSKSSANTLTAWDFLDFISSKAELTKYYAKHALPASRKDILSTQTGDTQLGVFASGALTARSVYKKDANVYEGVFLHMIDDVILNNKKPDEALNKATQQINLNLQQQ